MCLEKIGLNFPEDYNTFVGASNYMKMDVLLSFDPNLGYAQPYIQTGETGTKRFGNWEQKERGIAILGNSTSDPCSYPWKSWGEKLYEYLLAQNREISVLAAGTRGYNSSDDLFKFIRDILPKSPDLVLSFSGINYRKNKRTPYINFFQAELFNKMSKDKAYTFWSRGGEKYIIGSNWKHTPAEIWLHNQKIMHAIAVDYGIKFFSFLQPNLITKKRKGMIDCETYEYIDKDIVQDLIIFQQEVKNKIKEIDYIIDATEWMDDTDGLFYDYCHLNEEGNGILAEKILSCIEI